MVKDQKHPRNPYGLVNMLWALCMVRGLVFVGETSAQHLGNLDGVVYCLLKASWPPVSPTWVLGWRFPLRKSCTFETVCHDVQVIAHLLCVARVGPWPRSAPLASDGIRWVDSVFLAKEQRQLADFQPEF